MFKNHKEDRFLFIKKKRSVQYMILTPNQERTNREIGPFLIHIHATYVALFLFVCVRKLIREFPMLPWPCHRIDYHSYAEKDKRNA